MNEIINNTKINIDRMFGYVRVKTNYKLENGVLNSYSEKIVYDLDGNIIEHIKNISPMTTLKYSDGSPIKKKHLYKLGFFNFT